MKIGIIKETKTPVDNRVAFTPGQLAELQGRFPGHRFKVQKSDVRAYSDEEYAAAGLEVADSVADCDILFGIKEADIESLIPGRHYFFFGHIAKMQPYNKPLMLAMMDRGITFSDYEYLTDESGARVAAFGWYAGAVGVYYTLRGWGLRTGRFSLPAPTLHFSLDEIVSELRKVDLGGVRIAVTGEGRVSQGAQHVLEQSGVRRVSPEEYLEDRAYEGPVFTVAGLAELLRNRDGKTPFCQDEFFAHPEKFESGFFRFAKCTDILITGHLWQPDQPVYLTEEELASPENRIRMIGDVTCDIMGSIRSTLRSSTHDAPFYDYNPATASEQEAFSGEGNITVMAVDTCPNALPRETSAFFGQKLVDSVLTDLLGNDSEFNDIVRRATIISGGEITDRFSYLRDYAAKR